MIVPHLRSLIVLEYMKNSEAELVDPVSESSDLFVPCCTHPAQLEVLVYLSVPLYSWSFVLLMLISRKSS